MCEHLWTQWETMTQDKLFGGEWQYHPKTTEQNRPNGNYFAGVLLVLLVAKGDTCHTYMRPSGVLCHLLIHSLLHVCLTLQRTYKCCHILGPYVFEASGFLNRPTAMSCCHIVVGPAVVSLCLGHPSQPWAPKRLGFSGGCLWPAFAGLIQQKQIHAGGMYNSADDDHALLPWLSAEVRGRFSSRLGRSSIARLVAGHEAPWVVRRWRQKPSPTMGGRQGISRSHLAVDLWRKSSHLPPCSENRAKQLVLHSGVV